MDVVTNLPNLLGAFLARVHDPLDAVRYSTSYLFGTSHGRRHGFCYSRLRTSLLVRALAPFGFTAVVFFHGAYASSSPLVCPAWCFCSHGF
ncbi:hypothetical protein SDJN02_03676, partial [Cucurbita argyrosperma subsp. argyrosperma]